jgi:hypothetical protein
MFVRNYSCGRQYIKHRLSRHAFLPRKATELKADALWVPREGNWNIIRRTKILITPITTKNATRNSSYEHTRGEVNTKDGALNTNLFRYTTYLSRYRNITGLTIKEAGFDADRSKRFPLHGNQVVYLAYNSPMQLISEDLSNTLRRLERESDD